MKLKPLLFVALGLIKTALHADFVLKNHPLYSHDYEMLYNKYAYGQELSIPFSEQVILKALPAFTTFTGNTQVIARVCAQLNNQPATPSATQSIITGIFNQTSTALQTQQLMQLCPAFKVVQYALEKQDLVLHKEVETALYQKQTQNNVLVLAGYDNLTQTSKGSLTGYNSYNVDTPYQMVGFNQKYTDLNLIEALAVSESYMQLNSTHARANFITVWANMGAAYVSDRWQVGLDAQGGYSFINTKRFINYLASFALSDHHAWQASGVFRLGYDVRGSHTVFTPYDNLSYLYGQEQAYKEKGALGANLSVNNEQVSIIRNQVGFKLKKDISKCAHFLFDVAWLYEKYLNEQTYQAAFVGTDVYGTFQQNIPTHNYARIEGGFFFIRKYWDLQLVYQGLYGKSFAESTGSIKIDFKY